MAVSISYGNNLYQDKILKHQLTVKLWKKYSIVHCNKTVSCT